MTGCGVRFGVKRRHGTPIEHGSVSPFRHVVTVFLTTSAAVSFVSATKDNSQIILSFNTWWFFAEEPFTDGLFH
jgi:hypothetical protein